MHGRYTLSERALPTLCQETYPGLGEWWVQIWDGDRVVGRAFGDTPHAAHEMAVKLAGNAAPQPAAAHTEDVPASCFGNIPAAAPHQPLTDAQWLKRWTHETGQLIDRGQRRDDLEQAMQPALNAPEAGVWSGPALGYSAKDAICPVCGYYCLGTGGFDCIDKPGLVRAEKGEPA